MYLQVYLFKKPNKPFFVFIIFAPVMIWKSKIMESYLLELGNVKDSMTSHCVDKKHQCELCDKLLDLYRCLKKQITDISKDGNLYKCEDCIKIIHQETKIEPTCESCGKTFTESIGLKKHILAVHEGRKDHKCKTCGKCFAQQSGLRKHIKCVHDGRKDHKCGTCGKSFTSAGYLRMHAAMHTVHQGNRDYKCDSCDKSFYQEGNLKRHIFAVHKDNKNNKCKYCSISFSRAAYLKKHIHIIHEGYKDHKCETCSKSFSERHHLKRHINAFHLQSDEKCDISINQGLKMEK